jgi:predicted nucleotide-binding protein
MKPRLFIGSSKENHKIALAAQQNLRGFADVTVWNQGVFRLSKTALDSLLDGLDRFDFGVFVFAADDLAEIRAEVCKVPRDNVVFELGLFIGRLGPQRRFVIVPEREKGFHLLSDLLGFKVATYNPRAKEATFQAKLPTFRTTDFHFLRISACRQVSDRSPWPTGQ